jgi:dolichyl-phosphate-mannose-protein mannosyltransferase
MSSPSGVRQRAPKDKKRPTTPNPETTAAATSEKVSSIITRTRRDFQPQHGREWDYKLAITIFTVLAFITRFWGIGHPNEVVFDEVHFGKVRFPMEQDAIAMFCCPRLSCDSTLTQR